MACNRTWIRDAGKAISGIIAAFAALLIGGRVISFVASGGFHYERTRSSGEKTTIRIGGMVESMKAEDEGLPSKP